MEPVDVNGSDPLPVEGSLLHACCGRRACTQLYLLVRKLYNRMDYTFERDGDSSFGMLWVCEQLLVRLDDPELQL